MRRSLLVLTSFVTLTSHAAARSDVNQAVIEGVALVKDGDGIVIDGTEIRLQGIAAPEDNAAKRELGGPESTANLRSFVEGSVARCELDGTRTRNRPVGVCFVGGTDIGEYQVRTGHARDCPRFSRGRYANAERSARAAGRNLRAIYPLPRYCVSQ